MSHFRAHSASLHLLSFGRSRFFSSSSFEKLAPEAKSGLIGTGQVILPPLLQESLTRCLSGTNSFTFGDIVVLRKLVSGEAEHTEIISEAYLTVI